MKTNIDTVLVGPTVVLVPYRRDHVPKYHEWMLDEDLRTLTASEPLTLEEEYEMQEKWQLDGDKLTFIILSRGGVEPPRAVEPHDECLATLPMVGDVNIFLHGTVPTSLEEPPSSSASSDEENEFLAEVEVMIAEPAFRRKGMALEALQLMLSYVTGTPEAFSSPQDLSTLNPKIKSSPLAIPPTSLVAKISDTNLPSIALFRKLGFEITKRVEVFQEVEMRFKRGSMRSNNKEEQKANEKLQTFIGSRLLQGRDRETGA